MRDDVGLGLRQEFEDAVYAVEESIPAAPPAQVDPEALAISDNFEITKAKIEAMKQACAGLTIAGIEDRKGYDLVHSHRMQVRDARTGVDKIRKALKEGVLARGRKIDSVAKELTALLVEIEEPLEVEEKRIDAERDRIKAEKQREADAKLQKRIEELQAFGQPFTLAELTLMTDTQYGFLRATAEDAFKAREALRIEAETALAKVRADEAAKAEAERKAKEEAERIERERVAAQAAENAKAASALEEARAALRKEQEEFDAKRRAQEQAAREEQARKDGEAKAKADVEAKAVADKAKSEAEAKRLADIQAASPDADKIFTLAMEVDAWNLPQVSTEAGRNVVAEIENARGRFAAFIRSKAASLTK